MSRRIAVCVVGSNTSGDAGASKAKATDLTLAWIASH